MSWVADGFRNAGNSKVPVNSLNLVSLNFSPTSPDIEHTPTALTELGTWNFVMRPL
jgi:hypothetical protein